MEPLITPTPRRAARAKKEFTIKYKVLLQYYKGVSENGGTPKSSILIGFSSINHPFWGTPIFGNTHKVSTIFFKTQYFQDAIIYCIWFTSDFDRYFAHQKKQHVSSELWVQARAYGHDT